MGLLTDVYCTECINLSQDALNDDTLMSLDGCKSVCGDSGSLWPKPESVRISQSSGLIDIFIDPDDSLVTIAKGKDDGNFDDYLGDSWQTFLTYFDSFKSAESSNNNNKKKKMLKVSIQIHSKDLTLDLDTEESYELSVNWEDSSNGAVDVIIKAETFFGARHGLETLSQLISFDPMRKTLQIAADVHVADAPEFKYRGLLLDTGRNYFSVASIASIIRGMSYDKLNVLHWHMNEQQSFPFVSKSEPKLTQYGAYSQDRLYYPEDVEYLSRLAHRRGIMLIPEFDAPAHASAGWEWGEKEGKGKLVVCNRRNWIDDSGKELAAEPNAGQLNPVNDNVYEILGKLYFDMIDAFTLESPKQTLPMFHMGGDEVNFHCWAQDEGIRSWLEKKRYPADPSSGIEGYLELWNEFQRKALAELTQANGGKSFKHGVVVWTSELSKPSPHLQRFLPKDQYVIQVWCTGNDPWIKSLLQDGYRLIMSNSDAWYLDCGFDAWLYSGTDFTFHPDSNWCSPFKGWKVVYENSPRGLVKSQGLKWDEVGELILGGEATMWSEQVDERGVEPRLWPRMSAFAERLWSDPDTTWKKAEARFLEHRQRLTVRGIAADVVQPEFCRQNEGWCYAKSRNSFMNDFFGHEPVNAEDENGFDNQNRGNGAENAARNPPHLKMPGEDVDDYTSVATMSRIVIMICLSVLAMLIWINRRILVNPMITRIKFNRMRI